MLNSMNDEPLSWQPPDDASSPLEHPPDEVMPEDDAVTPELVPPTEVFAAEAPPEVVSEVGAPLEIASEGQAAPEASPETAPEAAPEPEPAAILPAPEPKAEPVAAAPPPPQHISRQPQRPPDAARCHRGLRPPPLDVWRYLSRQELLRLWLGEVDLELTIGGEFALHAWNGDIVRGHVLQADPPSALAFTWKPHGTGTESRVAIRLQGDGPGTRITVRHEGLSSEPERRQARRLWREVLGALRAALHDERDAHQWGASLPIAVRAPLARSAADIWPLLSTADGLEKWLANVERFDGVPDGQFRFSTRYHSLQRHEEGSIELISHENRVVLAWEWAGESWGARTKVELSLEADPSGSALLLLHSGFDKIAPEKAAIARREYAAAWPRVVADLRRYVAPLPV